MTDEDIEAEYWAYHYQSGKTGEEFEDEDEGAADDYMAQIIREAEAEEAAAAAAAAAGGSQPTDDPGDWGPEE